MTDSDHTGGFDLGDGADGVGSTDGSTNGSGARKGSTYPYRYAEQYTPPQAARVSEVAVTTFEHVFEVDPRLMQRWVLQQTFPNWDTLRIMNSRHDHLDWMHAHFATKVIQGSEILADLEAPGRLDQPGPGAERGAE